MTVTTHDYDERTDSPAVSDTAGVSTNGHDPDAAALDAYSRVVSGVAHALTPSVASLRVEVAGGGHNRPAGAGSAVVVSPEGLLLTSAHVVNGASGGTASFTDGSQRRFEVVGADPLSDLAVVRVTLPAAEPALRPATLGDADTLVVGQLVVAVGNPLGFDGSISAGVVSGLGRSLPTRSEHATRVVDNVIQTDAALHPGNSGGALADSRARVVGINTAVVGPGIGQGLGLAVPINRASDRIIAALIREGRVRRAYLGVGGGVRPLPAPVAREYGQQTGIEVTTVVTGGPADRAGVRPGDVLLSVDDVKVETVGALQSLMTDLRIGLATKVVVWRDGKVEGLSVRLAELRD